MKQPLEDKSYKGHGILSGPFKRKYSRAKLPGFVVNFADGKKVIGGVIENISTGGFESDNLPKSFAAEKHTYTAILSGYGKHYKMLTKPCWRKNNGENFITIGFKILDAPWTWVELTMKEIFESK